MSRRRRLIIFGIVGAVLAASGAAAWWLTRPGPHGSVAVDPSHSARVTLDQVTVDVPAHAVDAPGTLTVRPAQRTDLPRGLKTGPLYEIVLSDGVRLVGKLMVALARPGDAAASEAWLAQSKPGGIWTATPATGDGPVSAQIDRLSPFGVGWLDAAALRVPLESIADNALSARAAQPECPDADQLEKQGITVDSQTEDVRHCEGLDTGRLIVRLVDQRAYPLLVRYDDTAQYAGRRGRTGVAWFADRFERLAAGTQPGHVAILGPAEQAEFGIDRIWQGTSRFTMSADAVAMLAVLADAQAEAAATTALDLARIGVLPQQAADVSAVANGWDLDGACTAAMPSADGVPDFAAALDALLTCVDKAAAPTAISAAEPLRPTAAQALGLAGEVLRDRADQAGKVLADAGGSSSTLSVTYPRLSALSLAGAIPLSTGSSRHMLVMDVSGSMGDDDGAGTIKIEGGKAAVLSTLDAMPASALIGLRTYPSATDGCGSRLLSGLTSPQDKELRARVRALKANGGTPTAPALRSALLDLVRAGLTADSTIILVSDGESNCGGDPCAVARDIAELGVAVIHTVGFNISSAGRTELECISQATGGKYFDATDATGLRTAIAAAANPSLKVTLDAPGAAGAVAARGEPVTITATVTNVSARVVDGARMVLNFPTGGGAKDNVDPGAPSPVRGIGNLQPGEHRTISWHYEAAAPPGTSSSFTVVAAATNAAPTSVNGKIGYVASLSLDAAGPMLRDRKAVVLAGDSLAAGQGAGAYATETAPECDRSTAGLGAELFTPAPLNLACAATTVSVLTRAGRYGEDTQVRRLAGLPVLPDLVLLSLGGDDAGLAETVRFCTAVPSCQDSAAYPNPELSGGCIGRYHSTGAFEAAQAYVGRPAKDARQAIPAITGCADFIVPFGNVAYARVAALTRSLPQAYRQVDAAVNGRRKADAPAPIVVLGYPRITPSVSENRGYCTGVDLGELRFLDEFTHRLNALIDQAVTDGRAAGLPLAYADLADSLQAGHTLCDRQAHVVTAASAAPTDLLHPDQAGYQALTAALVRWSARPDVAGLKLERKVAGSTTVSSRQSVDADVAVAPNPPGGTPSMTIGSVIRVTGDGFGPGVPVTVTVASVEQAAGAGRVSADGHLGVAAALPDDLAPGTQTLVVSGWTADGRPRWAYAVTTAEPPLSLWQIALMAVAVLLIVAAVLIWWLWRRRRQRAQPEEAQ